MAGYSNEDDEKTLLDVAMEYAPESALIYGLTRAKQDGVIKNFADRVIRDKIENDKELLYNDLITQNDYKYANVNLARERDFLVDAIHNMPEELQDSFLLSVLDSGDPKFDYDANSSFYNPRENSVTLKKYDPFALIHEYIHSINQNMNNYNKKYYRQNMPVPDRMAEINLGKIMDNEFVQGLREKVKDAISRNDRTSIDGIIKNFIGFTGSRNASDNAKTAISDILTMNPYTNVPDKLIYGHNKKYKKEQISSNKMILPKSNGTAPFYAPMGIEGAADLGEVLASRDGEYWMKQKMPKTLEAMMNEFRNDPRKKLVEEGRFIIPWLWNNNENTEEYKYVPESNREYYIRVKSPYGGYKDGASPYLAEMRANDLGRPYYEYRDLDGNWKRQYTDKFMRKGYTKPTFEDRFQFYAQTPNGRKGFRHIIDAAEYRQANPDIQEFYELSPQKDSDGKYIIRNGEPVKKWKRIGEEDLIPAWKGRDVQLEKHRKDRKLMDKIRNDKLKQVEKELAKKAVKYIRMVK